MADKSKIEWTDATWNPATGCTKASEGCQNCYARRMAHRLAGRFGYPKENPFAVTLHPERLEEPLRWKNPRRIFVCSMSDLFHEAVPFGFIWRVFDCIAHCPQHSFLILTKRPKIAREYLDSHHTLPNVWLGVSVENQKRADERIPVLLQISAAKRFVSIEPMLGPVDLMHLNIGMENVWQMAIGGKYGTMLNWVIVGGESGPKARPMHIDWARSIRDQCKAAGVPFFFKQWGEWGIYGPNKHFDVLHWRTKNANDAYKKLYETDCCHEGCTDGTMPQTGPVELIKRNIKVKAISLKGEVVDGLSYDAVEMGRIGKKKAGRLLDGKIYEEYPK